MQWEGDWELIDGIPYSMAPSPFMPHQDAAGAIYASLRKQLQKCKNCHAFYELDWIVNNDTVVRPDVSVVCAPKTAGHIVQVPSLIVEVLSKSTAIKDREVKTALYAKHGVRYYVLIDTRAKKIEALELKSGTYASKPNLSFPLEGKCVVKLSARTVFAA